MYFGKRGERVALVIIGMLFLASSIFLISQVDDGNSITGAAIGVLEPENNPTLEQETIEMPSLIDSSEEDSFTVDSSIKENLDVVEVSSEDINLQADIGTQAACASWPCNCGDTITASITMTTNLSNCVGNGLNVVADDIIVNCDNYNLTGDAAGLDYGINLTGRTNVTIIDCNISDFYRAVLFSNANYSFLQNSTLNSSGNQNIWMEAVSNYNTFDNNIFLEGASTIFYIENSSYNNITNNQMTNADPSFIATSVGAHNNYIYNNNMAVGIISLSGLGNNTIYQNNISFGTSYGVVTASTSNYNNITANTIFSAGSLGAVYLQSSNNTVSSNQLTNNTYDVYVTGNLVGNNIIYNSVTNSTNGIYFANGNNNLVIHNNTLTNASITILGDYINITNNTFLTNGGTGISISAGDNNSISGNNISGCGTNGIFLSGDSAYNIITNNYVSGCGAGELNAAIYITDDNNTLINQNTLLNSVNGIYFHNSTNQNITNNYFQNLTSYAILAYSGTTNKVRIINNTFTSVNKTNIIGANWYFINNTFSNGYGHGILFDDGHNSTVIGNTFNNFTISGFEGVSVATASNITIQDNNFTLMNSAIGVYGETEVYILNNNFINTYNTNVNFAGNNSEISNNYFYNFSVLNLSGTPGFIIVYDSNNLLIYNNTIALGTANTTDQLPRGIAVTGISNNITVRNNNIDYINGTGIFIGDLTLTNITVFQNSVNNVTWGIYLSGSSELNISNNNLTNNNYGLTTVSYSDSDLTLANNYIANSSVEGLHLSNVSNSLFINNTFYNNEYAVYFDSYVTSIVGNNFTSNNYVANNYTYHFQQDISHYVFQDENISNSITSGIYINGRTGISNLTWYDSVFTNNTLDVTLIASNGIDLVFVNTTFNSSKMDVGLYSKVYFKKPVEFNVTDNADAAINSATVTAYDATGSIDNQGNTSSNGYLSLLLTEFYYSNGVQYYITQNHSIVGSKLDYMENTTALNLINASNIYLNITLYPLVFGVNVSTDSTFGSNLTGNGSALIISEDNVVINGEGYFLIGNGSGIGIDLSNRSGVLINNLSIINFTEGVRFSSSTNNTLNNLIINNVSLGINLTESQNNVVKDCNISLAVNDVIASSSTFTNNTLLNLTSSESYSSLGNASLKIKEYLFVNSTYNSNLPLPSGNVTGNFNSSGLLDHSILTSSTGIAELQLTERTISNLSTDYNTPHNITLSYSSTSGLLINSTSINITTSPGITINLSVTLDCTAPGDNLNLNGAVSLCPGSFVARNMIINTNLTNVTCDNTILLGDYSSVGITLNGADNVLISGCELRDYYLAINVTNLSWYFNLNNLQIHNSSEDNDGSFSSGAIIVDGSHSGTISGCNISNGWFGIGLVTAYNSTIFNNTITSVVAGITPITNSAGNNITGNNLTGCTVSFGEINPVPVPGYGDIGIVYHNYISSSQTANLYLDANNNSIVSRYNNSIGGFNQGNAYSDYCDMGSDLDGDGYADNVSSPTANDWPYNATIGLVYESGCANGPGCSSIAGTVVDYHPLIQDCPAEVVYLTAGGSSGGSSTTATAGETTAPTVTTPTKSTKKSTTETYSAEETKKYLNTETKTQNIAGKTVLSFTLENTGDKEIKLFATILQNVDDPFFIVNTKTLGSEDSAFYRLAAISYSNNPIAGRLLEATLVDPGEIIIPPGETIERTIEINEGLSIPRQIKVQFTTFGETFYEEEIATERTAVSGSAIDLDTKNNLLDVYVVLASEETFLETNNGDSNTNSLTGAVAADILSPNLNRYTVEMNINSKDGKTNHFSDIYGPYNVKTEQALLFAQQYKYNPEVYDDEYQVQTKIYKAGELVTENTFDVEMNGGEEVTLKDKLPKYLSWVLLIVFVLISFVFVLLIITKTNGKKKSLKKEEL